MREEELDMCSKCNDTGVIETGNNDLPCSCSAGDTALFNNSQAQGGPVTGVEVKRHFLNTSLEPIIGTIRVEDLPRKGRILVVDDDEFCRRYVTGVLTRTGYRVVEARDGVEGLRVFREDKEGFALVLSDWSMPYMRGPEMLHRIRRNYSKQRLLMMSSDPQAVSLDLKEHHLEDVRVLDKSFHPHELEKAVGTLIEAPNEIRGFFEEWRFLSNFHLSPVVLDGEVYISVESAYQAAKTLDLKEREKFRYAGVEPKHAKRMGRALKERGKQREDWQDVSLIVMKDLLMQKFYPTILRRKLLRTFTADLVEGNNWHDCFYGVCDGTCKQGPHEPEGLNHLGRLLMEVRAYYATYSDGEA